MHESGAHDLRLIEEALLADDPRFTVWFHQAARQLDTFSAQSPPGPVVVSVDGSPASMRAVQWAAHSAGASGAEIRIVHVFRQRSYPLDIGTEALENHSCREAAQAICRAAVDLATAVAPHCRVSGTLVCSAAAPALLRAAGERGLLVLSGSRRGALLTWLGTSTRARVLARSRCAVAVLPAQRRAAEPVRTRGRVSAVLDGGPGDTAAMTWALRIADEHGCGLSLACLPGRAAIAASTAMLRLVRGHLPAPDVTWMTGSTTANVLAQLASSPVAVVVDSSAVPMSGLARGRAGRQMLAQATCPVVLTCAADVRGWSRR